MRRSIRTTFFSHIAAVLAITLVLMGVVQTILIISYFSSEKRNTLQNIANSIAIAMETGRISLRDPSRRTIEYMAEISDGTIHVTNANGRVLFATGAAALPVGTRLPRDMRDRLRGEELLFEMGTLDGFFEESQFTSVAAVNTDDGPNGYILASSSANSFVIYITEMIGVFILSALFVLILSSGLSLIFVKRISAPLDKVEEVARRFGEGEYTARVPEQRYEELDRLALTFNEMAQSLEVADVSRRSFMGDIAHELRTPMTTIKGFIDGILDGTIPPELTERYLLVVSDEVGRLARLTNNMLDISRLEAGEYAPESTVFNLWEPVHTVLQSSERRLRDKDIQVQLLGDADRVPVLADIDYVHQVLLNITDNAIKFSNYGGEIAITIEKDNAAAVVTVRNSGSSLPQDMLGQVFHRFYKADKSRSVNAGGAGLGLHICRVLVGLMNGRMWADSDGESWTSFSFTLPAAAERPHSGEGLKLRGQSGLD